MNILGDTRYRGDGFDDHVRTALKFMQISSSDNFFASHHTMRFRGSEIRKFLNWSSEKRKFARDKFALYLNEPVNLFVINRKKFSFFSKSLRPRFICQSGINRVRRVVEKVPLSYSLACSSHKVWLSCSDLSDVAQSRAKIIFALVLFRDD